MEQTNKQKYIFALDQAGKNAASFLAVGIILLLLVVSAGVRKLRR